MNHLSQTTVKTLTIYTRKQIAEFFKQFKDKVNEAYDREDVQAIRQLVFILKLTIVLLDVPGFGGQLNQVGDIQITSFLEALYVKNTMWKMQTQQEVRNCSLYLMNHYQQIDMGYRMTPKLKQLKFSFKAVHFSVFYAQLLQFMHSTKQIDTLSLCVDFFKVLTISQIQATNKKGFQFYASQKNKKQQITTQWSSIVKILIKYCRLIESLNKQQTAISISYWLCTTQRLFVKECINQGIVNVLKRSLMNKNISESYGLKIVSFLKLLLGQIDNLKSLFTSSDFQTNIVKFSQKFDNQKMLKQLRQLMNICERKNTLNHKQKFQLFRQLASQPKVNQKQLIQNVHLIGLYAQSDKVYQFLTDSETKKIILNLIKQNRNIVIFKQLFSLLSYVFQEQKGDLDMIKCILQKLGVYLQSNDYTKVLLTDRKKILINFVRMLKSVLSNKKYLINVIDSIKQNGLQKKLIKFSDCTNFIYEKQLLSFKLLLKSITKSQNTEQDQITQKKLIKALQNHLIQKSNSQIKKLPGQDQLAQTKLLYQLLIHNPNSSELQITSELVQAISKKTFQSIEDSGCKDLHIFESSSCSRINQIKNQINYYSLQFLKQLFKNKAYLKHLSNQVILTKNIRIGINTQNIQVFDVTIELIVEYFKNFGIPQSLIQVSYQLWKRALQKSKTSQGQCFKQVLKFMTKTNNKEFTNEQIVSNYFKNLAQNTKITPEDEGQFHAVLNSLEQMRVQQFLKKIPETEPSKLNLLSYLFAVYEFSKKQHLHALVFKLFSSKLKLCYASQIQSPIESSQQIKNVTYLILAEIIQDNLQGNIHYFNQFLKISLIRQYNPSITKQSVLWVQKCLQFKQITSYEVNSERFQDLLYFVDSHTQLLGIQCAINLQTDAKIEEQFIRKHKLAIQQSVDKNDNQPNLNFLQKYSQNCGNDTFTACGLITIVDKLLISLRNNFVSLKQTLNSLKENNLLIASSKGDKFLCKMNKKSLIIHQFNCSQKIILNQTQCEYIIRQLINSLQVCRQVRNKINQQNISSKNKEYILAMVLNLLRVIIYIYKNPLQPKEIVYQHNQLFIKTVQDFVVFDNSDINQALSQLFRLMILKDKERKLHQIQKQALDAISSKINKKNTKKGMDHFQVCKLVLGWGAGGNKKQMAKLIADYFMLDFLEEEQPSKQVTGTENQQVTKAFIPNRKSLLNSEQQISDVDLIKYLKTLLNPPYKYGLNVVSKFLKPVKSKQYVDTLIDVFILSSQLYEQDILNKYCSLQELRQIMIDTILQDYCDVNERFFVMIKMGRQGSSVCLRKINIGLKGVRIICQKMILAKDNDNFPHYAQILSLTASSFDELQVVHQYKIPTLVNQIYRKKSVRPEYCIKLGHFIGQTSKLQQIQQQYATNNQLLQNLTAFRNNQSCIAATLSAIAGVVYCNQGNQKYFATQKNILLKMSLISGSSEGQSQSQQITQKGFKALANLVFKNKPATRLFLALEIEKKTLMILQDHAIKQIFSPAAIKQMLRLLGILASTSEGAFKLINLRYLDIARLLISYYLPKHQLQIIKMAIDVVFNVTNLNQNDNRITIQKLHQQKVIQYLAEVGKSCVLSQSITQSVFDTFENLFAYDFILDQGLSQSVLQLMQQVSQTQQTSQVKSIVTYFLDNLQKMVSITILHIQELKPSHLNMPVECIILSCQLSQSFLDS